MKNLEDKSISDLVQMFADIAVRQGAALAQYDTALHNRLFIEMGRIDHELQAGGPDARRALMPLYYHPNLQVQIKAAKRTLAVAPIEARAVLERIRASGEMPQALDAGMSIRGLDDGSHKPT